MAFLEQIKNSTFAWIVLSLIAVASFVWAIYSHFTNNKKKRFSVASSSYEIIKEGKTVIPNLKLFFCGKSIKNLTVSKFAIWNSGNKVINSDDLISTEKLQIYADEGEEILEAQIVGEVEPTNLFDVSTYTEKNVFIDFDYVDSHEGIIVQVLHTGKKDCSTLHVKCKIKGGQPIKYYSPSPDFIRKRPKIKFLRIHDSMRRKVLACLMLSDAIMLLLSSLVLAILVVNTELSISNAVLNIGLKTLLLGLLTVGNIIVLTTSIERIKSSFTIGVPSKLKSYSTY